MGNEKKILCPADYIGLLENVIEKQMDQGKEGKKGGGRVQQRGQEETSRMPRGEEGILLAYMLNVRYR
ncbi:MAG: hypothetical protein D3917_07090 [Candidatus Electrothrix sp. AX5]|uniref:Uncharacterized protein n=1 Tax=Candidatus Electrothrix aarhusensis TaxID=1859131 RepID=A0A444IQS3_9BACT|nr:hypothetical protein [Candidatus Electrothrix sp. AX5]RWX43208.1 hypothetical protein H206_03041 [Candidatus Electrothrix aarhusensis]